jgi:hypothetical protein
MGSASLKSAPTQERFSTMLTPWTFEMHADPEAFFNDADPFDSDPLESS